MATCGSSGRPEVSQAIGLCADCLRRLPREKIPRDVPRMARKAHRLAAASDREIPYSLLVFHPDYRLTDLPPTPREQAEESFREAGRHLSRIHSGNLHLL